MGRFVTRAFPARESFDLIDSNQKGDARGSEGNLSSAMIELTCAQCGMTWLSPERFEHHLRHELGHLFRSEQQAEAVSQLALRCQLQEAHAKTIGLHVTQERDHCHQCSSWLDGKLLTECRTCHAVNYDF